MAGAFVVDAVCTAVGKRGRGFAGQHPADMAARVIRTVVDRHDTDPEAIDDVILGCSDDIGSQAGDIAWTAAPASLLHELERAGGRHGLQAMCEGGGQVNVTLIERR